jgi:hypothetical protein
MQGIGHDEGGVDHKRCNTDEPIPARVGDDEQGNKEKGRVLQKNPLELVEMKAEQDHQGGQTHFQRANLIGSRCVAKSV